MSAVANPVAGALVHEGGRLTPMLGSDASADQTYPPEGQPQSVPLAMTEGRQMSAAKRMPDTP